MHRQPIEQPRAQSRRLFSWACKAVSPAGGCGAGLARQVATGAWRLGVPALQGKVAVHRDSSSATLSMWDCAPGASHITPAMNAHRMPLPAARRASETAPWPHQTSTPAHSSSDHHAATACHQMTSHIAACALLSWPRLLSQQVAPSAQRSLALQQRARCTAVLLRQAVCCPAWKPARSAGLLAHPRGAPASVLGDTSAPPRQGLLEKCEACL